jgi:hypothetical protein
MIFTFKEWSQNEKSSTVVELTFIKVDEDTGNLIYLGDNGKKYMSLKGEIHSLTNEGEPDVPVKNVIVKDGEPVYDKSDRFGKNLEFNSEEMNLLEKEGFEEFKNRSKILLSDDTYLLKRGKNMFILSNSEGKKEFENLKDAIEFFKEFFKESDKM